MEKFKVSSVKFLRETILSLLQEGNHYIELTVDGFVYPWVTDNFLSFPPLPAPPCINGVYTFNFGYSYALPSYE